MFIILTYALLSFETRLLFFLAAQFLWIRWWLAAWSIFLTASLTATSLSSAFVSIAVLAFLIAVLRAVLRALLLAAFAWFTKTLFFAELMFAFSFSLLYRETGYKGIDA